MVSIWVQYGWNIDIAFEDKEIYVCKIIYVEQKKRELEPADVVAKYNDPNDIIYGESHNMIIGEIVDHIVR